MLIATPRAPSDSCNESRRLTTLRFRSAATGRVRHAAVHHLGVLALASVQFGAAAQGAPPSVGDYIVVLKDGVGSPAQIAAEHGKAYGFKARFVYSSALRGYAATLPEAALRGIAVRPDVAFVSIDGEVHAPPAPFPGEDIPVQRISFSVDRIDGDLSSTRSGDGRSEVNINVAVIDAGPIDADHPDLNVVASTSCLERRTLPTRRHFRVGIARWSPASSVHATTRSGASASRPERESGPWKPSITTGSV